VWHAVVWILWRSRNEKIFFAKDVDAEVLFDKIQITSWKWLVAKKSNAPCLFYEWHILTLLIVWYVSVLLVSIGLDFTLSDILERVLLILFLSVYV
jgi:hypothetical protein